MSGVNEKGVKPVNKPARADMAAYMRARRAKLKAAKAAERQLDRARTDAKPLAKDVLQRFMLLFAGLASVYQPGTPQEPNPRADLPQFEKWSRLTLECARLLAPFESPTFRAAIVAPPPPAERVTRFKIRIFDAGRPDRTEAEVRERVLEDARAEAAEPVTIEHKPAEAPPPAAPLPPGVVPIAGPKAPNWSRMRR